MVVGFFSKIYGYNVKVRHCQLSKQRVMQLMNSDLKKNSSKKMNRT
uniref:Uncharacterized protein n=1 Tax=Arundo donax TaxID=35708 RepID=A0A0A9IR31_ARUDO